jgi:hypothetical protein
MLNLKIKTDEHDLEYNNISTETALDICFSVLPNNVFTRIKENIHKDDWFFNDGEALVVVKKGLTI